MLDDLQLRTGVDIPFPQARVSIHNPSMKEIGFITENNFHPGMQFLIFSKDVLSSQDKTGLENKTDFDIFMSIMCSKEKASYKNNALMVLSLLFPNYKFSLSIKEGIKLTLIGQDNAEPAFINNSNFAEFKEILNEMFDLKDFDPKKGEYNPENKMAARIAEKLKKGKRKSSAPAEDIQKIVLYGKYISILTVGEHKNMVDFNDYTVYGLKDEFKRFLKKQDFDYYVDAKMAGAQNLEEVDNWMS